MDSKTMERAVAEVQEHVADTVTRKLDECPVGAVLHQGDVYLHRVADDHPHGAELGTRQVAVGTTIGSRHVVVGSQLKVFAGVKLPDRVKAMPWCRGSDLLGPVVVAGEAFVLTHPEHAHHECPAGKYQVTYQADFSTRQRVSD